MMTMTAAPTLEAYRTALAGCRFCPMCKPAGEVSNLTQFESHTTRGRAMLLWRILKGQAEWDRRTAELLYQSTLDSISQAWCISHYPVSEYAAAARAQVFEMGLAPVPVRAVLERPGPEPATVKGEIVFLGSEAAEVGDETVLDPALRALEQSGIKAQRAVTPSGALAYCLGDRGRAREHAQRVVRLIEDSRARLVIADGPQTAWALRGIYPTLGVGLPAGVTVTLLSVLLADSAASGKTRLPRRDGLKVLTHDCRSACLIADTMAVAESVQPGYRGPEEGLGTGEVYEAPRRLVDGMGAQRLSTVWSRSLARSCGADDGLWLTYPSLAQGLARQALDEAGRLRAQMIVCDSLLCAAHLSRAASSEGVAVRWLPALIAEG